MTKSRAFALTTDCAPLGKLLMFASAIVLASNGVENGPPLEISVKQCFAHVSQGGLHLAGLLAEWNIVFRWLPLLRRLP